MKYRTFYAYWVMDEVKSGNVVYALDRELKQVFIINEMTVDSATAVLNGAEADSKRYEFWVEETEEKENGKEL